MLNVKVSTVTLNFSLYKYEMKIFRFYSNFYVLVVHEGRGV